MARELAAMINIQRKETRTSVSELQQLCRRLETSGYGLRKNPNLAAMAEQRSDHMGCVNALADQLGRPTTVLVRQS